MCLDEVSGALGRAQVEFMIGRASDRTESDPSGLSPSHSPRPALDLSSIIITRFVLMARL